MTSITKAHARKPRRRFVGEEANLLTVAEHRRFHQWLDNATDEELLACEVPAPTFPVAVLVVGGR